jgi:stalled ribosome rescue protein Dom34
MSQTHAVVWMDHADAHILHFTPEDVHNKLVHGEPHRHTHHKRGAPDPARAVEDQAYYEKIADALADASEVVIAGPANAKTAFVAHLNERSHHLRSKIIAIETVAHPSDGELLDYARKHFRTSGQMRVQ